MSKKYYKSPDEYAGKPAITGTGNVKQEFSGFFEDKTLEIPSSRRDFLKIFGFSIASAAVAASCEQPVRKAIPYLIKPESVTPGNAAYYASTFYDGSDFCSILVKVRDGRPIKIEGNELSSVTAGGTSARTQASVLSLYDTSRYRNPAINGKEVSWDEIDKQVKDKLSRLVKQNKPVVLLSSSIISPSTRSVIKDFLSKYPHSRHVQYDAVSASGMPEANRQTFGLQVIPSYHFDKARVIVSFGADFLGSWLSPIEYTRQYISGRKITAANPSMSRHIQLEGGMSLTGSNADERIIINPSQELNILADLYDKISFRLKGKSFDVSSSIPEIETLAEELLKNSGNSLVISGSNDVSCQVLVNGINYLLGNYGKTIDLYTPLYSRQGIDTEMTELVESMNNQEIGGIIIYGANPVYNYPEPDRFREGLKKCDLTVSMANLADETAASVQYLCPDNYYLESWNDAEIKKGYYSLAQPAIHPIFNTRPGQDTLMKWSGNDTGWDTYLKTFWKKNIYPLAGSKDTFYNFWIKSLQYGVFELKISDKQEIPAYNSEVLNEIMQNLPVIPDDTYELILYENVSIGSGQQANNPWLQELPDPVSKVCWDNYAALSPKLAKELAIEDGNLITLNRHFTLPVVVQPGQAYRSISVALGYGRKVAGRVAEEVGINVFPLVNSKKTRKYVLHGISIEKKPGDYSLAMTQTHHSMEGRHVIRETTLEEYLHDHSSGNEMHKEAEKHNVSLYRQFGFKGHHWGMAIDLNSCTGCSACVVACSAENNVPVVGKTEVHRVHEMHWIRIDRYYKGKIDHPEVVRQPVMCQHCDNAPCENVCPVAATNHSDEGLNQMIYNRCIGTRYCNNNCPYKVRRFNFWDYTMADSIPFNTHDDTGMTLDLKRMVLNPDVTVRAKGVIEKCSMCVQRIQEKKLNAKLENRTLRDGEIKTACSQACPANAIVFGDLNDPESRISKMFQDERNYHLLEELHTLPSVGYLTKIRNKKNGKET